MFDEPHGTFAREPRRPGPVAATSLANVARSIGAARSRLLEMAAYRRDIAVMNGLPDHLLHDIGLGRSQIEHAVHFGRSDRDQSGD